MHIHIRADKAQPKPYLLFDAGGTLVFPDQSFLVQQARTQGIELSEARLFDGYYRLIYALDCQAGRQSGRFPAPWARGYAYALFETLGIAGPATDVVAQAFEDRHCQKNLWTFTFDWVRKVLSDLAAQGYRMSIISNSDGRTAQVFHDLCLAHYFERIFDSKVLGFEKPDPAIFEATLDELDLSPTDTLYVGDIFYVDVLGANQAGLGGLHLDPLRLYRGWPGVHLRDVRDLPGWLGNHYVHSLDLDLFPLWNPRYSIPTNHDTTDSVLTTLSPGEPFATSGALHKSQPALAG
jgi:FMN phosphatase YigB (HAD superfamily)